MIAFTSPQWQLSIFHDDHFHFFTKTTFLFRPNSSFRWKQLKPVASVLGQLNFRKDKNRQGNISVENQNHKEIISLGGQNLDETISIQNQNLKDIISVDDRNLDKIVSVENQNLQDIISVDDQNLDKIVSVENQNLKDIYISSATRTQPRWWPPTLCR